MLFRKQVITSLVCILCLLSPRAYAWKGARAIRSVLDRQEQDWNNGDIPGFMKGYWNNDSMMFVGKKGPTFGYRQTLENYLRSYPDTVRMGKLNFELLSIRRLGRNHALVVGKWQLRRQIGDIGGCFSLVFRRIKGIWYIIADHTS